MRIRSLSRMATIGCVGLIVATAGWSQTLTWLGTLSGFDSSAAYGVSVDGSVVVGVAVRNDGLQRAFRWQNGVMQDLGTLGGSRSFANAVSADGSVVVGLAQNAAGQERAFRWQNGVMQDLGTLGGSFSAAYGVSENGSVVVGTAQNAAGQLRAFRWTQATGMQDLGTLGGLYLVSSAHAVSADGSVVVGHSYNASGVFRAVRWKQVGNQMVIEELSALADDDPSSAYAVSADGSVAAGAVFLEVPDSSEPGRYPHPFRWAGGGGMQLGTNIGGAYGVSADGSVLVGDYYFDGQWRAFRWTQSGMEDLNQTYASLLTDGSVLVQASAISPDGRYIVGSGYNPALGWRVAFLLDTRCASHNGDVDNNGCVDDADLLAVLFAFGNAGSDLGRVDVNCDEVVDDADLLIVLFNFGSGC